MLTLFQWTLSDRKDLTICYFQRFANHPIRNHSRKHQKTSSLIFFCSFRKKLFKYFKHKSFILCDVFRFENDFWNYLLLKSLIYQCFILFLFVDVRAKFDVSKCFIDFLSFEICWCWLEGEIIRRWRMSARSFKGMKVSQSSRQSFVYSVKAIFLAYVSCLTFLATKHFSSFFFLLYYIHNIIIFFLLCFGVK